MIGQADPLGALVVAEAFEAILGQVQKFLGGCDVFVFEVGSLFEFARLEFGELRLGSGRALAECTEECGLFVAGLLEGVDLILGFFVGLAFGFEGGLELVDLGLLGLDGGLEFFDAGFEAFKGRHCGWPSERVVGSDATGLAGTSSPRGAWASMSVLPTPRGGRASTRSPFSWARCHRTESE